MKKLITIVVSALALLAAPAFAATAPVDPAVDKAVRTMLDSMNYRKVVADIFAQMQQSMPRMILESSVVEINNNQRLTAAQKKKALARAEQQAPLAAQQLRVIFDDPTLVEEMIEEMVPLYGSRFTVAEIEQLAAFYQSPVGAKLLAATPQIAAEAMQIGQRVVLPRMAKMVKANTAPQ